MTAVYAADATPPLNDVNRQLLFELNVSGWVFSHFQDLQLTLWQLDPLRDSAYIPLPRWIQTKRAVVNVVGTGDDCFRWAILAGMHPVDVHPERRVKYAEHMGKYDFSSLPFPTPLQSVGPFALRNNMSINAYGVDDDKKVIYPLRVLSTLVPDRHVDLLLFECDGVQHYATIRHFSRLVGRQFGNHGHTVHCCCLHAYSSQELLDTHALDCCNAQRTKFPKDSRCRFTNYQKQLTAPLVVYADFESILQRVDEAMDTTQGVAVGGDDEAIAASGAFQEHLPCSFAYKVVSSVVTDFSMPLVSHSDGMPARCLCANWKRKQSSCFRSTSTPLNNCKSLAMQSCAPSTLPPTATPYVRDHCHIVGNYRGTAHSRCNLAYRISKSEWKLPVVMHNLKGYDGHLIAKALKSEFGEVRVIPPNMENYLSITVGRLKFIDSLQFTPQSLDSLVKTIEVDELKYAREAYPIQHEFELIKRKGVYPYDYMQDLMNLDCLRKTHSSASCLTVRVWTRNTNIQLKCVICIHPLSMQPIPRLHLKGNSLLI